MAEVEVKPSPDGVPGAVTDPSRVIGEDIFYIGSAGVQVNAYLARPASAQGPRPAMIVRAAVLDVRQTPLPAARGCGRRRPEPSPDVGAKLRERAGASGQQVQVDVYDGAGHAFFADYRPSYRPGPAALLWERVVPFLARYLGGDVGA
jgi:dienelactone hydrolase